jgi:uncharacterized membrane protein
MSETNENINKLYSCLEGEQLTSHERKVIEKALARISMPRDVNTEFALRRSFGERASDAIAAFGGSWTFILSFGVVLVSWAFLNTEILGPHQNAFDPYPYVFLNLILSMIAALQAPIIMMSQNRQNAKDRLDAEIDHSVNVHAELAIHNLRGRLEVIEQSLRTIEQHLVPASSNKAE